MRLTAISFGLAFMCAAFAVAVPPQDGEDVRGAFLTSRRKKTGDVGFCCEAE